MNSGAMARKSEARNPKRILMTERRNPKRASDRFAHWDLGASDLFWISGFVLRVWWLALPRYAEA
jgi:hypothetical protein